MDRLLTDKEFIKCATDIDLPKNDVGDAAQPWAFGINIMKAQDAKTTKYLIERIEEQTKFNMAALARRELIESPFWQAIKKEL